MTFDTLNNNNDNKNTDKSDGGNSSEPAQVFDQQTTLRLQRRQVHGRRAPFKRWKEKSDSRAGGAERSSQGLVG